MKIPSLKILAASIALLGLPGLAMSQVLVSDTVTQTELGTMNAQLQSDATYLQTGYNGNGLLPLLSSINDKLGKSNASDAQTINNNDAAARRRIYDQKMLEMKASATPTQEEFKRACVDITSRLTSAQGHGAAGGASDAFNGARVHSEEREAYFKTATTLNEKLAVTAVNRGKSGYCSKEDVENGAPGCDGQDVGALPSADNRGTSLTIGATSTPSAPSNGSLSPQQAAAAQAYILKTAAMPPNIPSPDALEKEAGKQFLAALDRFTARQSASGDALNNILSSHRQIPYTVNGGSETSPSQKNWATKQDEWGTIFGPKIAFPAIPSERDMLRYEVFHFYASPQYTKFVGTINSEIVASREIIKQQALTNRLLFQMIQRQEDANMMMAQILNQNMDPLTTEALNTASIKVQSGK